MLPRLIPREDEDVSDTICEILEKEGVRFELDTKLERLTRTNAGFRAHLTTGGSGRSIDGTHLLMAVGRRPNTDDLGLDKAGISTDARGYIQVDDELMTNVNGGGVRLPTRRTTTSRLWRPTCSTTIRGGSATGSWCTVCPSTHHWDAWA